jgi:hypothetical protein
MFRPAPILVNMTLFVSVSLAICFSVGLMLSSTLTYLDIRNHQSGIPCLGVRLPLGEDCGNCCRYRFNRPRDHGPRCSHNCTPFNTGAVLLT